MKLLKHIVLALFLLAIVIWFGVKDALTPLQRSANNQPIFTIGDAHYQQALTDGKNIVKFGQMFWGLYPGGLAFSSPDEAVAYAQSNQQLLEQFSSGWAVYELSGDFAQDTYLKGKQSYLKQSLLVVKRWTEQIDSL